MKRDYKLFVKDILDSIDKIESFVGTMSFDEFIKDEKTKSAVIREIEVIGEATKNIPDSVRNKCTELPWKDMARMRDKITHFYFGIYYETVWKVIKERLPGRFNNEVQHFRKRGRKGYTKVLWERDMSI